MHLTTEQSDQLINKLLDLAPNNTITCPVCGKTEWELNTLVSEVREFQPQDINVSLFPYVTLTCKTCSHALLFNAIRLGLINSNTENKANTNTGNNE